MLTLGSRCAFGEPDERLRWVFSGGSGSAGKLTSQGIWLCRCVCYALPCMFVCACSFRLHKSMSGPSLNGQNQVLPSSLPLREASVSMQGPLFSPPYKNLNMETVIGNCLDNLKWFILGLRTARRSKQRKHES